MKRIVCAIIAMIASASPSALGQITISANIPEDTLYVPGGYTSVGKVTITNSESVSVFLREILYDTWNGTYPKGYPNCGARFDDLAYLGPTTLQFEGEIAQQDSLFVDYMTCHYYFFTPSCEIPAGEARSIELFVDHIGLADIDTTALGIYVLVDVVLPDGSGSGAWCEFTVLVVNSETGIPYQQTSPNRFSLHGNYPNPFNPTTTISYQLSANSNVSLQVYDTAGRLVATLVNGWRTAGTQEVTFDGSDLPSGAYVYCLQSGDYKASGKMVLMK